MIGYLQGRLIQSSPEKVLVDVGGVGYAVHIPLSTYYEVERAGHNGEVRFFIHTYLRDDSITLFGFWTEEEQRLFEKLIAVAGIGPRLAQVILSGMPPAELLVALAAGDAARLTRIPGVGHKTAARLVLELKEQAQEMAAGLPDAPGVLEEDLILALVNLGYKRLQAERAVTEARKENPDGAFPELLRLSLQRLSRV
jgi:Holliday junction DNA helicase RuvA